MTDNDRQRVYDGASALKPKLSTVTMKVGDHQFQKINTDDINAGKEALKRTENLYREIDRLTADLQQAVTKIKNLQNEVQRLKTVPGRSNGFPYQN